MEPLNVAYKPRTLTQPGCIEAILEYLGVDVTPDWLWGASGIAFFMNIADDFCPSSHHSHGFNMNHRAKNVGYEWTQYWSNPRQDSFEEMPQRAWDGARESLEAGHPGLLWHWEWMVVRGYDDAGYVLSGTIQDHLAWEDLGSAVGWLELVTINPGAPADDATIVGDALKIAIGCWDEPEQWGCTGVPKGYDLWIAGLGEQINPAGAADTTAVYAQCRQLAAGFLREAHSRLDGPAADLLADAISHYAEAAELLARASEALPLLFTAEMDEAAREAADAEMVAHLADLDRRNTATAAVSASREAEARGVEALRGVLAAL